jgi:hypothetical protein
MTPAEKKITGFLCGISAGRPVSFGNFPLHNTQKRKRIEGIRPRAIFYSKKRF